MKTIILKIKRIFFLKYILFGFFIAFLFHSFAGCNLLDDFFKPKDKVEKVDVARIEEGAQSVETAFLSGDANNIKDLLTENALSLYGTELTQTDKKYLIKLGEALETKKLIVYSDMYAEYEYVMDGKEFTISFARQEGETWKLMRY